MTVPDDIQIKREARLLLLIGFCLGALIGILVGVIDRRRLWKQLDSSFQQGTVTGLGVSKGILKELRSGLYLLEADPLVDTRPQWEKTDGIRIFPNEAIYTVYTNRMFTNWTLIVAKP